MGWWNILFTRIFTPLHLQLLILSSIFILITFLHFTYSILIITKISFIFILFPLHIILFLFIYILYSFDSSSFRIVISLNSLPIFLFRFQSFYFIYYIYSVMLFSISYLITNMSSIHSFYNISSFHLLLHPILCMHAILHPFIPFSWCVITLPSLPSLHIWILFNRGYPYPILWYPHGSYIYPLINLL